MQTLASRFVQESCLELHSFLNNQLAEALEKRLRNLDTRDGLGQNRAGIIPSHTVGTSGGWTIKGPPTDGVTARFNPQKAAPKPSHIRVHIIHP